MKVFLIELDFKIIIAQTNPFRISVRLFLDTFKALKPEMNPRPTLNSAASGDRNYCRLIRKKGGGSNPGGDEIFGLSSLLYNGYRVFPGGKVRPRRAADHSPHSNAVIMEE